MNFKKADFDAIYNERTPNSYLRTLASLSYRKPDFVHAPLTSMARNIAMHKGQCTVLDVASSYGFNGGILKFNLPFGQTLPSKGNNQCWVDCQVIGIDVSVHAIEYAITEGYIDAGITQNLEKEALSIENRLLLRDVDLIVASGAFSYVTGATFDQLLDAIPHKPAFLGWPTFAFDASDICRSFSKRGIDLQIENTAHPMRNFISEEEKSSYFSSIKLKQLRIKNHQPEKLSVYKISSL